MPHQPKRIYIVGPTCSGKTTTAREIARILDLPHIELDPLFHGPNWTPNPNFVEEVEKALPPNNWVVDGNYGRARHITWTRAQTVIWIDYPFPVVLWQALYRTIARCWTREELWNGNRETFWKQFFTRDSLLLWLFKTFWKVRRNTPERFKQHPHVEKIHLRSRKETKAFLDSLHNKAP